VSTSEAFGYNQSTDMGHPRAWSMADAAGTPDGRAIAAAVEQLAFEQRTANLIQYLRDNGALDPAYGTVMTEIRARLALADPEAPS
jgi:hypothetical protein